jgi:glyoxylase-like metal-dependent hydrolase (beta-lactamase superfamily II)
VGFFHGAEAVEWTRALGITDPSDPVPFNFGSFLLRDGPRTVLVDSGFGPPARTMGMPGGGELLERLTEVGVRPEEVDAVVHTHLHGDHCGWNVTEEGGAPILTFPNAEVWVSRIEFEYWTGSQVDGSDRATVARRNSLPVQAAGRLRLYDGEATVAPGAQQCPRSATRRDTPRT